MTDAENKPAPTLVNPQPAFRILGQYIKDLSFENPNAPRSMQALPEPPTVKVEVNVGAKKLADKVYESCITFEAKASTPTTALYAIEIEYAGAFQLENIPENALQPVLFINCPMLLYPFLRRLVADLTHEGSFPTLHLEPIDFAALYAQNINRFKNAPTAAIN